MRNMHVNDLKNRPDLTLSNYINRSKCKKLLGQGAFGIVELYQCETKCNNSLCKRCFIVKTLIADESNNCLGFIKRPDKNRIEHFYKEYEIGMMLHHPNIRRTLDIDVNFETIILEHCDGIDLLDYLNDYDHSGHCGTVKLFSQLIDAVDYLHTNNIVHLDIKLENIIINPKNNIIKLIDLGEAMLVEENQLVYGLKGTEQYMAPEILSLYEFNPKQADLWCCGIILYNLYYNRMPWSFAKLNDIHYKNHSNNIKKGILKESKFSSNRF